VVPDTEKNTDFGITLVGRNFSGYGVFLNDNFISLMENFNKSTAPASPLEGQLWYNPTTYTLQLWDDRRWKRLAMTEAQGSAPTSSGRVVGDFWYDTQRQQLFVWAGELTVNVIAAETITGSIITLGSTDAVRVNDILTSASITSNDNVVVTVIADSTHVQLNQATTVTSGESLTFTRSSGWYLVGPSYSRDQQVTGLIPTTIIDTQGITRHIALLYQHGRVVGSVSRESEFYPRVQDTIPRLPLIKPGITLIEDAGPQVARTILADSVGSAGRTVIALSSLAGLQTGDFVINGNIAYNSSVQITALFNGNSSILINTATIVGLNEVMTFQRGVLESNMFHGTATNAQQLAGITADRFATLSTDQIFQQDVTVQGNLYAGSSMLVWDNGGDLNLYNTTQGGDWNIYANISGVGGKTRVAYVNGATGELQVSSDPVSSAGVSNKNYVDASRAASMTAIAANVAALIGTAGISRRDFGNVSNVLDQYNSNFTAVNAAIALRATISSPALSGTPTAPTPVLSDSTTAIATTAFVQGVVAAANAAASANAVIQDAQIQLKAPIDSPTFTGSPATTAPNSSDRTTRIATTKFVGDVVDALNNTLGQTIDTLAPIANPVFQGSPVAQTPEPLQFDTSARSDVLGTWDFSYLDHSSGYFTRLATVGFVAEALSSMPFANLVPYATKVSPALEGVPTAPTPNNNTSNDTIATTRFVKLASPVLSVNNKTGTVTLGVSDIDGAAPLISPALTGIPTAPKPAGSENSTQIATTNWVKDITSLLAPANNPTFTGVITMSTPSSGVNSDIATTCRWVNDRLATADVPKWGGSTKYVMTRAPTAMEGNNGDIWFQYAA
jgi:hypothetical protein